MKFLNILIKKKKSEGFILASIFLFSRLKIKLKSLFYSKILNASNIILGPGCHILGKNHIKFGSEIYAHKNLWLEAVVEYDGHQYSPQIVLGNRIKMSDGVHITAINRVEIGADVLFGSNVYVSDHNHGVYSGEKNPHSDPMEVPAKRLLYSSGVVMIGNNVWIGDNVNIVGPVSIGHGAIIASNSVVRNDIPAVTMVAGIPARSIKKFNNVSKKWERYV
ncbi:hypothetical protein O0882_07280 [Janthinobacterium sp. SUN073]|uniref:hypothetical protein n=1 Tax=Janthinobacterium sp. SUN073 TaxID=3004102 RepID=UPI0025B0498A|nr:hypothetical protein [Janthinobacterium sp. SUN073]MDN2696113.1 hypothetical protein [Janthinobacterium sp. SUN073]